MVRCPRTRARGNIATERPRRTPRSPGRASSDTGAVKWPAIAPCRPLRQRMMEAFTECGTPLIGKPCPRFSAAHAFRVLGFLGGGPVLEVHRKTPLDGGMRTGSGDGGHRMNVGDRSIFCNTANTTASRRAFVEKTPFPCLSMVPNCGGSILSLNIRKMVPQISIKSENEIKCRFFTKAGEKWTCSWQRRTSEYVLLHRKF